MQGSQFGGRDVWIAGKYFETPWDLNTNLQRVDTANMILYTNHDFFFVNVECVPSKAGLCLRKDFVGPVHGERLWLIGLGLWGLRMQIELKLNPHTMWECIVQLDQM